MHIQLKSSPSNELPTRRTSWRLTALASALSAILGLSHFEASALALGRITALSSLGEPLVASIEVPDINAEELASLKSTLASPEAFKAAGMEYNAALANAQVTLTKRTNGSSYLLVKTDKVVNDPFLNLVVQANWATGRIVRNYTLLLDPPAAKQAEASVVTTPIAVLPTPISVSAPIPTPAPPTAAASAPVPATVAPVQLAQPVATPTPAPAPAPTPAAKPSATPIAMPKPTVAKVAVQRTGDQIRVEKGDTAAKIAANNLPANVSLDQMLVALLRGNPQAFVDNNINRLKTGVVLDLPTEAEAAAVSAAEARRDVIAQSKDFNSFRRKLAENAPIMASKTPDRVASGKIESKVEDKKAAAPAPDKLTLSKGEVKSDDKTNASKDNVEKIAKDRQSKDDATRAAELAKNIKDLNQIASKTTTASATNTTNVVNAPKPAVLAPTVAVAPGSAAATASATTQSAVTPTPPKPPVAKAPSVVAPVETSLIDDVMNSEYVQPAAFGLLAALLGGGLFAAYKKRKKRETDDEDDALLADNFDDKSFFNDTTNEPMMDEAASAGQLDKKAAAVAGSTQVTQSAVSGKSNSEQLTISTVTPEMSPSDGSYLNSKATVVDPLTEADVYLGYGKDAQAEEILKDALKTQPENTAIYSKLMDIYANRRDAKNFELMALKAKLLVTESSPEWDAISKQGYDLEPTNPLYALSAPELQDPLADVSGIDFSTRTVAQLNPDTAKSPASVDLDLDFDFVSSFPAPKEPEAPKKPLVTIPDFALETVNTVTPAAATQASILSAHPSATVALAATTAAAAVGVAASSISTAASTPNKPTPIEFDMGGLSLDLNSAAKNTSSLTVSNTDNDGPMETKLALAQEFHAIGDNVGAKMLVNEVVAQANGALKTRAQALLAQMG